MKRQHAFLRWPRKQSIRYSKKDATPLDEGQVFLKYDALELDELCISHKHNVWLWTAVSRYSGHLLAWCVGDRSQKSLERLWSGVPESYRRRTIYTDGYSVYAAFFAPWQHQVCEKFDGGTCTVEGVNNSMRHRCGALVRRTSARCRHRDLLDRRIGRAAAAHNRGSAKRLKRRLAQKLKKRQKMQTKTMTKNYDEKL